jgi:NitT/TauT family transport system substrate-binding protein
MKIATRVLAVAAMLCLLAACGSGSGTSTGVASPTAGTAKTPITVGVGTATFIATLDTPFFAADGLVITQQKVNSGAAAIPLLLNGQLQFTATDSVGALTAIAKGLPLVIVGVAASSGTSLANDATAVVVKQDSAIQSAADLAGKNVAVNAIGNTSQLSAAAAIDKLGGSSAAVHFVEMPPSAINAAVLNGTVAAGVVSEPSITQGKANGLRALFSPMAQALPGVPLFVYITSQSYLAANRSVVQTFARDLVKANNYANQNPQVIRDFAAKTYQLTPAQATSLTLPQFVPTQIQKPALQRVVDLMVKYKTIASPVDLSKAVLSS